MSENTIINTVVKHTQESLLRDVVNLSLDNDCTILDALVIYMNKNELEVEQVAKLVGHQLKAKLAQEGIDLKLLKKDSNSFLT